MATIDQKHDCRPSLDKKVQRRRTLSAVDRYCCLDVISSGSYGLVRRALDIKTGEIVAIKEEFHGRAESTAREISILQSLPRHPSIVEFRDVIECDGGRVLVMEFVENDLSRVMEAKRWPFTSNGVQTAVRQILEGVAFLHDHGVMHRDIKPSNILVSGAQEKFKLCDFGISRRWSESGAHTPGLGTRCYSAPEVLSGTSDYSAAVDMWSVGCVMAELVLGEVLFAGVSELQQWRYMCRVMEKPGTLRRRLLAVPRFDGAPALTAAGMDLLQRLLAGDASRRITAREALNHAWFKESC